MPIAPNFKKIVNIESARKKKKGGNGGPPTSPPMFGKGLTDQTMQSLSKRFSKPKTEEEYRNRALFSILSKTGLRAKEIVSLRFSKLVKAPTGETLITFIRKGGHLGYAVIPDEALKAVRDYHKASKIQSDMFFLSRPKRNQSNRTPLTTRSLQRIVGAWDVTTCQGRKVHPHALRHTVGQKLLDKAGSIAAQKVLGHSSPVTTAKFYTKPYFDGRQFLDWQL
ncbi:site-specific integrase [Leptospira koniambonensis]|uniref:Site-specific integrase n=1 Tax=Leptospira koniambonensis TaxID=2484950 RepID=A0A4R9JBU5_9LEPT|nr:tyrosine-type recombinase/integrase [Leptospira koniambonensis]TGL35928.1 site-specific integrase [Leptospira koniambonensis]